MVGREVLLVVRGRIFLGGMEVEDADRGRLNREGAVLADGLAADEGRVVEVEAVEEEGPAADELVERVRRGYPGLTGAEGDGELLDEMGVVLALTLELSEDCKAGRAEAEAGRTLSLPFPLDSLDLSPSTSVWFPSFSEASTRA